MCTDVHTTDKTEGKRVQEKKWEKKKKENKSILTFSFALTHMQINRTFETCWL